MACGLFLREEPEYSPEYLTLMKQQKLPAPVKEIRAGVYCKWLFRQQRARGVLPFSLLHQKRRKSAVGWRRATG